MSSKFIFSIDKNLLEPHSSIISELMAHKVRSDCGHADLSLRVIPGVIDTDCKKVVVKISLHLDFSMEYLSTIPNHAIRVYSSVKGKDNVLKSRQFYGTFDISEKDNPLLLVADLCSQEEAMTWSVGSITVDMEVVEKVMSEQQ